MKDTAGNPDLKARIRRAKADSLKRVRNGDLKLESGLSSEEVENLHRHDTAEYTPEQIQNLMAWMRRVSEQDEAHRQCKEKMKR